MHLKWEEEGAAGLQKIHEINQANAKHLFYFFYAENPLSADRADEKSGDSDLVSWGGASREKEFDVGST